MGNNRSSTLHSHPPPPGSIPPWPLPARHGHGSVPQRAYPSPFPQGKRSLGPAPGAYAEPYIPPQHLRRSMISLNGDSGFISSPADSSSARLHGSRLSLNQMDFDRLPAAHPPPPIIIAHDAKTLKKLEKMEKKQAKLWKKLGGRLPPPNGRVLLGPPMTHFPPPPPPPPLYSSRAMSFDDVHRLNNVDMEHSLDWRRPGPAAAYRDRGFAHLHNGKNLPGSDNQLRGPRGNRGGGSLSSSSPMTSSEEGHTMDPWSSSGRKDSAPPTRRSPPAYNSNHKRIAPTTTTSIPLSKTIEVKVERSEKVERIEKNATTENNRQSGAQDTYAQPILRNHSAYGSRSSLATSQLRGDQSEIDFSWVNEEEDKLNKEQRRGGESSSRLPECYFGMEPPPSVKQESSSNRRSHGNGNGSEKENKNYGGQRTSVMNKAAIFEEESRKRQALRARAAEPSPDYSRAMGNSPSERRLHRIQQIRDLDSRLEEEREKEKDRRWRSSLAL